MLKFIEILRDKIKTEKERISRGSNNNKYVLDISFNLERRFKQLDNLLRVHWIFEYLIRKPDRVFTVETLGIFDGRMIEILFIQQVISMDLFPCRVEGITRQNFLFINMWFLTDKHRQNSTN